MLNRKLLPIEPLIKNVGYSYKKIDKNIFLIENFITDNEHKRLNNIIESADWLQRGFSELPENIKNQYKISEIENLIKNRNDISPWTDKSTSITTELDTIAEIVSRIQAFAPDGYYVNTFESIHRHFNKTELPLHKDTDRDPKITYAMVLYLNNASFGGELYFKDLEISIMPPPKSLIIFDGDYLHGVKAAWGEQHRYSLPSFMHTARD